MFPDKYQAILAKKTPAVESQITVNNNPTPAPTPTTNPMPTPQPQPQQEVPPAQPATTPVEEEVKTPPVVAVTDLS